MARDPTSFADATAITQKSSHTYSADFPEQWCIGSVPHGGFITSCFLRVAALHFSTTLKKQNQPNTITLHLEFLRRTEVGAATFTVQEKKLGRQTSTVHITLSQEIGGGRREEVVGYITQSNLAKENGPSFSTNWSLHPAPAAAVPSRFLSGIEDPNWRELTHRPFAHFRKAMNRVQFMVPKDGQGVRSAVDNWMCLTNGENWTNESVGFVADMFMQLLECHKEEEEGGVEWKDVGAEQQDKRRKNASFWYPTVLLNLDVKKSLPAEGAKWLFSRVRAKQIKNGRYDLEVVILDDVGDIVALSHHVVLALDASRNLAKRNRDSGSNDGKTKL